MVNKKDLLLLLTELQESGVDCKEHINTLYTNDASMFDTMRFINKYKPLELVNFYEKLRKSYNHKSSKLYKNIVQCDENSEIEPNSVLTTLSAFLNQALLFKTENKPMFLKHVRAKEIAKVLSMYLEDYDINPAYKLLTLIKADLVVAELINGHRV